MINVSRLAGLTLAAALASFGAIGVAHAGVSPDNTCGGSKSCVAGTNTGTGNGVLGKNTGSGYGVLAQSGSNITSAAFNSSSGIGALGESANGTGAYGYSTGGFGLQFYSNDTVGLYGSSGSSNGADITGSYIGVIARSNTYPFVATDDSGNDLFFLDGAGNVFYHGSLNTFLRTPLGGNVTAYGPKSASPTVEDVGSGHVVNGIANVRLDPAFAQTIDGHAAYHVFVTPGGDTRGLYVTAKTPTGFVVRETQQGRGTLDFDYRIVATPLGQYGQRSHAVAGGTSQPRATVIAHGPHTAPH